MDVNKLLTISDVMDITTLGRSTIYAYVDAGSFPKPIHLTERKIRWTSEDIQGWIQGRIDERDNGVSRPTRMNKL